MAEWRSQVTLIAVSDALRVKGRGRHVSYGSFAFPQSRVSSQALRPCLLALLIAVLVCGAIAPRVHLVRAEEATPGVSGRQIDAASSLSLAANWLLQKQEESGGFQGYSGEVDASSTAAAVVALYAARKSNEATADSIENAMTYLDQSGGEYAAAGAGQAANLVLAAIAGGRNPRDFAGEDLIAALTAPPATPVPSGLAGIYGDDLYDHAVVLIALVAAGETVPDEALDLFRASQAENGGWAFAGDVDPSAADSNTTSLTIQALVATGHGDDPMVAHALAFLHTLQAPDGSGFAYEAGDPLQADANSTALVVQALIAAGEDPSSESWGNAMAALLRFQTSGGGFRFLGGDSEANLFATVQAMPAVAGLPLPVVAVCDANEASDGSGCVELAPAA